MTGDAQLIADVEAAERRHRESKCRCATKVRLIGQDGPSMTLLFAAWRLAEALCDEFDAPADKIIEQAAKTQIQVGLYRDARRPLAKQS